MRILDGSILPIHPTYGIGTPTMNGSGRVPKFIPTSFVIKTAPALLQKEALPRKILYNYQTQGFEEQSSE